MQTLWQHNVEWDKLLTEGNQQEWLDVACNIQETMCIKPKSDAKKQTIYFCGH